MFDGINFPPAFVLATLTSSVITLFSLYYDTNKHDGAVVAKLEDSRRQVVSITAICVFSYVLTLAYRNEIQKSVEWHSSPIDWCEENYQITPYVVEFWNTLSSSSLCVAAVIAGFRTRSFRKKESGWIFWEISFFCIGLGSMYFHATLSVMGQVLDEMPIIWLAFLMSVIVSLRKQSSPARRFFLSPTFFAILFLLTPPIAILYPNLSHAAVLACLPYGIYITGVGFKKVSREEKSTEAASKLFLTGVKLTVCGAMFWICDRVACDYFVPYLGFNPQFHAIWHVLVSSGAFCGTLSCQYFSARLDGFKNVRITTDFPLGIPGVEVV